MEKVGMLIHTGLNAVKCMHCEKYFSSGNIAGHIRNHGFPIAAGSIAAALMLCESLHIPGQNKDCAVPVPGGPPVEGGPIGLGFTCEHEGCYRAKSDEKHMVEHQTQDHPGQPPLYSIAFLQALYSVPQRIFAVNPGLVDSDTPDLIAHLSNHVLPPALVPPPILLASDDRGRNPIENHFRFDMLMGHIRESRTSLALLARLKKAHTPNEDHGLYEDLHKAIQKWHKKIVNDLNGNTNHFDLERFLHWGEEIPKSASVPFSRLPSRLTDSPSRSTRWRPVSDGNETYDNLIGELLRAVIRHLRGQQSPLPFPLTPTQEFKANALINSLADEDRSRAQDVVALQALLWELVSIPTQESWSNIFQVFFAFLALRVDGTYAAPTDLSPDLAKFKYLINATCMAEALAQPFEEQSR